MIYVTGDIHGKPQNRFGSMVFPRGKELTKDDYIIVLGDFGMIWSQEETAEEKYWLDWLNSKPWTTLFICGNHENYDRIETYPTEMWNGGLVQKIRPSVIHLMYGEVFTIDGKTFMSLGGAASHDIEHGILDPADYDSRDELREACREIEKEHGGWIHARYRIKGIDWWEQEVPNNEKRHNALKNIIKNNMKIDYILSHEAPCSCVKLLKSKYEPHEYSSFLETIRQVIDYDKWFFGHYHVDWSINGADHCLYENILLI